MNLMSHAIPKTKKWTGRINNWPELSFTIDQYWIDKIMDYLNQTIFFLYELCGLCPYISCSYLGLARPSSQGSYTSCIARTCYRPCGAQKNENVVPLLKSKNFKMVTGNLSQAQDSLSTGSLCGCSGHVPMKLAWCTPLCDEALNVWANCLRVVFFWEFIWRPHHSGLDLSLLNLIFPLPLAVNSD